MDPFDHYKKRYQANRPPDPRRNPRKILEEMPADLDLSHIVDTPEELIPHAGVAYADQVKAAMAEAEQLSESFGRILDMERPSDSPAYWDKRKHMALLLALVNAWDARVTISCPHMDVVQHDLTQPGRVDLTSHVAQCMNCLREQLVVDGRDLDDGRCDVCDVRVADERFWPISTVLASTVFSAMVCDDCFEFIKDAGESET